VNDYGELKQEKPTKAELFATDPDRFIDLTEVIFAVKRGEKGMQGFINSSNKIELFAAKGLIDCEIMMKCIAAQAQQQAPKIVTPNGGFGAGIRNVFKRGK
jgi:hypothetical protein